MRDWWERWRPAVCGLSLGCYAGRVIAESSLSPWPTLRIALLLVVCNAIAVAVVHLARRFVPQNSPLLILLVYVVSPGVYPSLALALLFVALVSLVMLNVRRKGADASWTMEGLVFVPAMALYLHTLAPTILPADGGEFQLVSNVLGIAHPPGYPLYTMLGKLFTLLPVGDAAYRVNLLSAVIAALTLSILARLVRRMTGSRFIGWLAALALAVAPTFWAQATTANIRGLTAFFTTVQLYSLFRYGECKERRYLWAFALAFGLGISHHGSLGLLALPYAAYLLLLDATLLRRWRDWAGPLGALLASLLVVFYLPVRSLMAPPFDPAPIRSLEGFLDHVLARGFGGDMFAFARPDLLMDRLPILENILAFQFGTWLLGAALIGGMGLIWGKRAWFVLVGGVFLVNAFVAITYRAPQTVEYLMPAYVGLVVMVAYGVKVVASWRFHTLNALVVALVIWAGARNLGENYSSFAELSRDRSVRLQAEALLGEAPPGAVILADWHHATPLWYLQLVEGARPDVDVEYVYPEGSTPLAEVWQRRIAETLPTRPVLATNHFAEYEALPYRFLPFHGAELVLEGALSEKPAGMQPLSADFGDRIRLCGYQLEREQVGAGEELVLRLCWQPLQALDRDYSFFVHLVTAVGQPPLGQGDKTHPAGRYQVGEVILDEYRIPLLPTTAPGSYVVVAGVYFTFPGGWERLTTATGQQVVPLSNVTIESAGRAPVTSHPVYLGFAGGLTCMGVDYDRSMPDMQRVYLHWWEPSGDAQPRDALLFRGANLVGRAPLPTSQGYGTVALDIPEGEGVLLLQVRAAAQQDARVSFLGPWHRGWARNPRLPKAKAGERHVVLGGEMTLESVKWDADDPWQPSGTGRVTLGFQALRPLSRDYSVSVSLTGPDGRFIAQHDTTPALGAIPTLKWIRGTRVEDVHLIVLPDDAPLGEASLRLTVYDAFSLQPLPVSDDRFARLGQGMQMELGRVTVVP